MQNTPLVSVIIPSFNHAAYVDQAIDSVLAQTYPNIELIVVDDGSSDNSHAVIRTRADADHRITAILNTENKGQSAVINQALAVARGMFIALLASDDWYLPHKIACQVRKFQDSDPLVGVVYSAGLRFFEDTGVTIPVELPVHEGYIARILLEKGDFIYPITPLFRRSVLDHIRHSEMFRAEGEAIHLRIALHYKYAYVDETVAVMRDHSYNIGKDASIMNDESIRHLEWYFSLPDLPEDIRALRTSSLLRIYRVKAMQLIFDKQDTQAGRSNIYKALMLDPFIALRYPKLFAGWCISLLPKGIIRRITAARKAFMARQEIHYTTQKSRSDDLR